MVEGNETLQLQLANLNTQLDGRASLDGTNTITIDDDDTAVFRFDEPQSFADEEPGEASWSTSRSWSPATVSPARAPWASTWRSLGTWAARWNAVEGNNFELPPPPRTVVFNAGAVAGTRVPINLTVIDNLLIDEPMTVTLVLLNLTDTQPGDQTLDGQISVASTATVDDVQIVNTVRRSK